MAINLACAAELKDLTAAVIDIDPQASATGWGDSRENEGPTVISAQAARLEQLLKVAEENETDLVVIDTAPHSESSSLVAARLADLILIPCRPAILDLRAIGLSIDLANLARQEAMVVLNAVPPRGSLGEEARDAIASYGARVTQSELGHRAAFMHSLTVGLSAQEYEAGGKAALEVSDLYSELQNNVDM